MFENVGSFFKKLMKNEQKELLAESTVQSKDAAKERLHVVLMQDRANVSADFLELMKEEIIEVIKKYIVVDESQIDVRLTNQENEDGSLGAPLLHANIPILNIRNDIKGEYLKDSETPQNVMTSPIEDDDMLGKTQVIQIIKDNPEVTENIGVQVEETIQNNVNEIEEYVEENTENEFKEDKSDLVNENELEVNKEKINNEIQEQKIEIVEEKQDNDELSNLDENIEEEKNIVIDEDGNDKVDDIDSTLDDEYDDDITFDDLLKAAEEEEERLKQLDNTEINSEEKKESPKKTAKKTAQKKKKTSNKKSKK